MYQKEVHKSNNGSYNRCKNKITLKVVQLCRKYFSITMHFLPMRALVCTNRRFFWFILVEKNPNGVMINNRVQNCNELQRCRRENAVINGIKHEGFFVSLHVGIYGDIL